ARGACSAVVSSRGGASMASGVGASLLRAGNAQMGVFEVDEGALPGMVTMVKPRVLVLTNIFRDQLDRFGEPERVAELFRDGVSRLDENAVVVANADDPALTVLGHRGKTIFFGTDVPTAAQGRTGG